MIHIFKSLVAKLWFGFIILVLLAGVLTGTARLMLPWVSQLRGELEGLVSEAVGAPVGIGRLRAGLQGLDPQLVLEDVSLFDAGKRHPRLHLDELRLEVDLLRSAKRRKIHFSNMILSGAMLVVRRHEDGRLELAGFGEKDGGDAGIAGFFLNQGRLQLKDSTVLFENRRLGAKPVLLEEVEVGIVNHRDRHQISAYAKLAAESGTHIRFFTDLFGDLESPDKWGGQMYLKGDHLPLSLLEGVDLVAGYGVTGGALDLEMWGRWRKGRLRHTEGRLRGADLEVASPEGGAPALDLALLQTGFQWKKDQGHWNLDLVGFSLQYAHSIWPQGRISIETREEADHLRVRAGADFLRVDDVLDVLASLPLNEASGMEVLRALDPRADVRDLRLDLSLAEGRVDRWALGARVAGWRSKAWKQVPAVEGADFVFLANPSTGWVAFDAEEVAVTFPRLFREPMSARMLSGTVEWRRDETASAWVVQSRAIDMANEDIATRSRFRFLIPFDGASPWADIQTDFRDADGAAISRYLPVGIMPKKLVAWLDKSLVSGRVPSGSFLLHGPLKSFPYKDGSAGRFEVLFGVDDLILDYDDEWPRLESLRGEVRFLNNSLGIVVDEARLLDSEVGRTVARIDDLKLTSPLEVEGVVNGPLSDVLRVLRETPLKQRFQRFVERAQAGGESRLQIEFAVPIEEGEWRVDGILGLRNASLDFQAWDLELAKINGDIRFDTEGLRAEGVSARILDTPAVVDIETLAARDLTRISARFAPTVAVLEGRYPGWGLERAEGKAMMGLSIDIGNAGKEKSVPISFALKSDLKGMGIDLPPPLGKSVDVSRELRVSGDISGAPKGLLRVGYGGLLKALLELDLAHGDGPLLNRGEVRLGGGSPALPLASDLRLVGTLKHLDLDAWMALVGDLPDGIGAGRGQLPTPKVDMRVEEVTVGQHALREVQVRLEQQKTKWMLDVESDLVAGRVLFPAKGSVDPVDLHLRRLALTLGNGDEPEEKKESEAAVLHEMNPRDFPPVTMRIDELVVNGQPFGVAIAKSHTSNEGVILDEFSLDAPLLTLDGSGSWRLKRGVQTTAIKLKGQCSNLGSMLRELGFTSALDAAPLEMSSRFGWLGAPWSVSLARTQGHLAFKIGKGRLLEVEPGVGRVFGLLNFWALQRRLSLDFSDLFKKGYAFDRIEGAFTLARGDAFTEGLTIEGPSARIEVKGRTGLVEKDYDQFVTVIPKVSSGIPVAGAIAGGPAVGAALLVAQKLLGKEVDKLGRTRYHVVGGWEAPTFEKLTGKEQGDEKEQAQALGEGLSPQELLDR